MFHELTRIGERWTAEVVDLPPPPSTAIAFICATCSTRCSDAITPCHGELPMKVLEHSIVMRDGQIIAAARTP